MFNLLMNSRDTACACQSTVSALCNCDVVNEQVASSIGNVAIVGGYTAHGNGMIAECLKTESVPCSQGEKSAKVVCGSRIGERLVRPTAGLRLH